MAYQPTNSKPSPEGHPAHSAGFWIQTRHRQSSQYEEFEETFRTLMQSIVYRRYDDGAYLFDGSTDHVVVTTKTEGKPVCSECRPSPTPCRHVRALQVLGALVAQEVSSIETRPQPFALEAALYV